MQDLDREIEDLLFRKEFYLLKNKLLNIDPKKKNYIFYNILGYAYQELGELEKAEVSYLKSLGLNNNFLEAKFNLAVLFYKKKFPNKAEKLFIDYIDQDKNNYLCYFNLGIINFEKKDYLKAIDFFKKTVDLKKDFYYGYHQLGLAYEKENNIEEAIKFYQIANKINKDNLNISYNNLGVIFLKSKKLKEALDYFKTALNFKGQKELIYQNIAIIYSELGEADNSIYYMKKAVEENKSDLKILSRFIGTFPYTNYKFNDYEFWSKQFSNNIIRLKQQNEIINFKKKKIHLGFFSADFRNHPVGYFLLDLLPYFKKSNFDIFFYSHSPVDDDLSEKIKNNFSNWKKVYGNNTLEIINIIKNDKIDILIDMSGHSNLQNLEVFANRAAPIQISWAAYLASTGLMEIDYIIGDIHVTPLNTKEYFVEKFVNLPEIWCHLSTSNIPNIQTVDTPAIKNRFITFGSFNNLNKITPAVIDSWSIILNNVKDSKLFIKNNQLDYSLTKENLVNKFKKNNIVSERLILEGNSSRDEVIKKYNLIDIALDTFPWTGGTTSFELSWMCVPLLTMSGDRFMSRCGESINKNLRMDDWIVHNTEDYIASAIKFSQDYSLLNKTRSQLREFSRKSSLFNSNKFSKNFLDSLNKVLDDYKKNLKL
jgi:predicted O-linked N-acetylglucosamine transferase (SPINDLY family)